MPKEIETKFKINSLAQFKKSLKKIRAKFLSKELERDTYYRGLGTIRLRSLGKKGAFTIKTPSCSRQPRAYKVRNEFEVGIDDAKMFARMLEMLGFAIRFRKEKIRETYTWKDAKILIDKLPYIGYYAEIEGSKRRIRELAGLLRLDMGKAIADTYMDIFRIHKARYRKRDLELIFRKTDA